MRKFKILFAKQSKLIGSTQPVQTFAEQTIYTTGHRIEVKPPDGFVIVAITEVLEDIYLNQEDNEKTFTN